MPRIDLNLSHLSVWIRYTLTIFRNLEIDLKEYQLEIGLQRKSDIYLETVHVLKRLMDALFCLLFLFALDVVELGREADGYDPRILIGLVWTVPIHLEDILRRFDKSHISVTNHCVPGVLEVVRVDNQN